MAQGFNISTFIASVASNGVMRTNKFLVRIHLPRGLQPYAPLNDTARYLEYWCQSVNIPGVSLATQDVFRYGYGNYEKKPYNAITNDVGLSFISDAGASVWTFFQQWMRMIVNYDMRNGITNSTSNTTNGVLPGQLPFQLAYKEDYISDVQILVFDEISTTPQLVIILREAFPIFVGDVSLNWGDTNDIARIPVTLSCYDWYNATLDFNSSDDHIATLTDTFNHRTYDKSLASSPHVDNITRADVIPGGRGRQAQVVPATPTKPRRPGGRGQ